MVLDDHEVADVIGPEIPRVKCTCIDASQLDSKGHDGDLIINCNARGFRSNVENIREFVQGIRKPSRLKLMGITESFACGAKNNYLEGHVLVARERSSNRDRGGVAFLVQNDVQFTIPNLPGDFQDGLLESLTIIIKDMKIIASVVYRPTACESSDENAFNVKLKELLSNVNKLTEARNFTKIIMGDFNFNLRNTEHQPTADYINLLVENGFMPTNCEVDSRVSNISSTLIDQLWISQQHRVQSSFVIGDMYISDHNLNGISINERSKPGSTTIKTRKITPAKERSFIDLLQSTDWSPVIDEADCNKKWEHFSKTVRKALDTTCPEIEVKIKADAGPNRVPWMTEGLSTSEKQLKKLMRKARNNKNGRPDGSTKTHYEIFREYSAIHSRVRRKAKREYFNSKFREVKHDSRATWNLLNKFTCNKRTNSKISELKVGNKTITDNHEIAQAFNAFYAQVGTTQASTIPQTDTDPMSYITTNNVNSMFLHPTDSEEVDKVCKLLAKKKSKGPDKIPAFLAINAKEAIMTPLVDCINSSLLTGTFPEIMKQAEVIPLYKKKERDNPTNYRPVSLLNAISKIIEKVIYLRLYDFMANTMFANQFGFRAGHSTLDLMILTIEEIITELDTKGHAIPLFFDLGKAFDTLDTNILLSKLEKYGVRGIPLQLIRSYLSNRSQYVTVNGVNSDPLPVTIGVPQGSILGPLLFIIYINDIPNADKDVTIACYADDTSAVVGSDTPRGNIHKAKSTLVKLGDWFSSNKLSLSPTKCKFALMSKDRKSATWNAHLEIYGKKLTEIKEHTDSEDNPLVGLLVNERLSYKIHVNSVVSKMRSGLFALKTNKNLPNGAKRNIYFSCIHSHIGYAGLILGTAPVSCTKQIATTQNKALRLLGNANYNASTDPLYKSHHILKMQDIFDMQAATYGWKFINNELPDAIANKLTKGSIRSLQIHCRRFDLTSLKNLSPIDYIVRTWNSLPIEIKSVTKLKGFKKAFVKYKLGAYA